MYPDLREGTGGKKEAHDLARRHETNYVPFRVSMADGNSLDCKRNLLVTHCNS